MKWPGIAKLQEEMSELGVELAKLHACPNGDHWDNHEKGPLIERVRNEMGDVWGALRFFAQTNFTNDEILSMCQRAERKAKQFETWHADDGMTGTKD